MRHLNRKNRGLTLMELMVTIVIISIVVLAINVMFVDIHRGWLDSYAKVHGGAAADAAMVQTVFNRIVRKASWTKYELNGLEDLTVYYYKDWQASSELDRYARFYRSSGSPDEMYVEHGELNNDVTSAQSTVKLSSHVSDLKFKPTSGGIEMKLALNDGRETTTLVTTAILHNE